MGMYGPPQGPMGTPGQPPMGTYGPPMGMPPPKKKGLSTGCWIAIVAVLGFFMLVGGIIFYIGYKVANDKDVQHVMGAIGEATQLAAEAQKAPGTNELRALGCQQAMALDAAKMVKLGSSFMDGGAPPPTPSDVDTIVTCQVSFGGAAPSCDDAAKAYIRGAAPHKNFMLSVSSQGKQSCGNVYSPAGAALHPIGKP